MDFTDEAIDELIAMYEKQFNEPVTREDARAMANRLVEFYCILLRLKSSETDASTSSHER